MLPVIKFVSNEPGKGTMTINGMPIPGLSEVIFETGVNRPTVVRVKIVASRVEIEGPAQIAMAIEEIPGSNGSNDGGS